LRKDGVSGSLQVARAALRNRAIRATLVAFLSFSVAEWTRRVALLVYGFDRGGAAGSGLIAVIQLVPAAVLTPFTSSLADRFHRPRVLLAGYLVAAFFGTQCGDGTVVHSVDGIGLVRNATGGAKESWSMPHAPLWFGRVRQGLLEEIAVLPPRMVDAG
jgi:MFS family permease